MRPFFSFFYYRALFVGLCLVAGNSLPGAAQPITSLLSICVQGAIGRLLAWCHSAAGAIPACCDGLVSVLETGMQRAASWGQRNRAENGLVFFEKERSLSVGTQTSMSFLLLPCMRLACAVGEGGQRTVMWKQPCLRSCFT